MNNSMEWRRSETKGVLAFVCAIAFIWSACGSDTSVDLPSDPDPGSGLEPEVLGSPAHHEKPAWSSQNQVAFRDNGFVHADGVTGYRIDPELAGLWLVNVDTGELRRVLDDGTLPSWSPDGESIVFVLSGHLCRVNRDGAGFQQLTFTGRNFYPSWSPSGEWIVFDSNATDPRGAYAVLLIHPDGTAQRDISIHGGGEWRMPSWSHDGDQVIYVRYFRGEPSNSPEIFMMTMTGDDPRRITTRPGKESRPVMSPDGTRIAYTASGQVWLMESNGEGVEQVTNSGGYDPSWSPDGTRLVYMRSDGTDTPDNGVLWILELGSRTEQQLTFKRP